MLGRATIPCYLNLFRKALQETGHVPLIESSPYDNRWAIGKSLHLENRWNVGEWPRGDTPGGGSQGASGNILGQGLTIARTIIPVSYTHLTLPTT